MTYKKQLVDNLTCRRRFHVTFDDEAPKEKLVELRCLHCDAVIFQEKDHPPVKLARDEVLMKLTDLSSKRARSCDYKDNYSPASKPKV